MAEFLTKSLILFVIAVLTVLATLDADQVQAVPIPGNQLGSGDQGGRASDESTSDA
ncbi:hypothetical protein BGZ90_005806, partial [Linnemannia elongata]